MLTPFRPRLDGALPGLACLALLTGCGSGTAALVAGSDDSGGSGTAPALTAFTVQAPKVSPAALRLESNAGVTVRLSYAMPARPGVPEVPETPMGTLLVPTVGPGEVQLPAGASEVAWDFAADLGSDAFQPAVDLFVRLPNGNMVSGGSLRLGLGNDPPVVLSVEPMPTDPADPSESSGNVEVRLSVRDSSADVVAITVEWRRASDAPDAWQPATAAGVFPAGIETEADDDGVQLSFFWNTNVDLADGDDDVLLRVTADDGTLDGEEPIGVSAPMVSALLHVDNNEEPIVQLQNDLVVASNDERRGIPVPVTVLDEESDLVEVLLQWRRANESFPELPLGDPAALDALLLDPAQRRAKHVCSAYPRHARGRLIPVDASSLRLPELAEEESWIVATGLLGRTLDLLRPRERLVPLGSTWAASPLAGPVAALPLGDGRTALVLDVPGAARLREIELATGTVVRTIAAFSAGTPSAMALEPGGAAVLVAMEQAGSWRLERVTLADGAVGELLVSDGAHAGPVRGLANLGSDAAVLTVGSALLFLDYRDKLAPVRSTLLTGLATPWGVAADGERIYVAEREAPSAGGTGRVLVLELDSHGSSPVLVRGPDLLPAVLERPSALALENGGARLLAVTPAGAGSQLVRLDLGARGENVALPLGPLSASEIAWIACGAEGLRCATLPLEGEILVSGGLEQRRTITAYEPATRQVSLDAPLAPLPTPGRAWRISAEPRPFRASPGGTEATFLWNSAGDFGSGQVFLRAVARDAEAGVTTEGRAPKRTRGDLDVAPLVLGGGGTTPSPEYATAADVDGDGDLDLVTAGNSQVTIFYQTSAGAFDPTPHVVAIGNGARHVAVADLDGDGDLDLALANRTAHQVAVHLQGPSGTFTLDQSLNTGLGSQTRSVAAADLDGDGDQDLVSANEDGPLTVFFQVSPGSFALVPLELATIPFDRHHDVRPADLDGDGDLDIVSAGFRLWAFFQTAPGIYDAPRLLAVPDLDIQYFWSVTAADLDGDGDQDLATGNFSTASAWVLFQSAPGSFEPTPLVLLDPAGSGSNNRSVAAADLDGDGDLDLAVSGPLEPGPALFLQQTRGSFEPTRLSEGGPGAGGTGWSVTAADIDGDGRQDLVTTGFRANEGPFLGFTSVFFQDSPAGFDADPLVITGGFSLAIEAVDLDGDSDLDLVLPLGSFMQLLIQGDAGSYESTGLELSPLQLYSLDAADLDGDGDMDLLSCSADPGAQGVYVFFAKPGGPFVLPPSDVAPGLAAYYAQAADMDGDGDLDIVSVGGGSAAIIPQTSRGTFGPPRVLNTPGGSVSQPEHILADDLDGDGDTDLATSHWETDALTLFLQDPLGDFTTAPLGGPGITDGPHRLAAGDMDGDGDLDLVSANFDSLTVFFQVAPGSFDTTPLTLPLQGGLFLSGLVAEDLDGDGDDDLAAVSVLGATVYLQRAPGRFEPLPVPAHSSTTLTAADLDGDGDTDLVSGNFELRVFWGGR